MKHESQIALLRTAADSIEMQEKAGIEPVFKFQRVIMPLGCAGMNHDAGDYEFPLAVVEGKPVFVGDELYFPQQPIPVQIQSCTGGKVTYALKEGGICYGALSLLSWNPPTPRTVMVELTVEDAEYWTSYSKGMLSETSRYNVASNAFYLACRKALEAL